MGEDCYQLLKERSFDSYLSENKNKCMATLCKTVIMYKEMQYSSNDK